MSRWTRQQRTAAGLLVALVLVTLPFVEILFGLKTGMYNDLTGAHPPRYVAAWANIRAGQSPFWWKTVFAGFNALGAGQSAVFYLPNFVFGWLHPVTAFKVWLFFHLWLGCIGWYVWSLRRWGSVAGAVVTALVGTINGSFVSHFIDTPFIAAFALAPWVLFVFDRLNERPRSGNVAVLGLLLAGVAVAGHPQMLWVISLGLGVLALVMNIGRRIRWRQLLATCLAVLLGLALSAATLIPQMLFGRTSVRSRLNKAAAFEFAEEPRHLWTLIAPNIMGGSNSAWGWRTPWLAGTQQPEQINYLGLVGLALAVVAAITLRRSRVVWAFVAMAVVGLLASLGGHTFIGHAIFEVIPFADRFRIWSRNLYLTNISVAILAGGGVVELVRRPRRMLTPFILTAAALAVVLTLLPTVTSLGGALIRGAEGSVARLIPVALVAGLAVIAVVMTRRPNLGVVVLILWTGMDLGVTASAGLWRGQGASPAEANEIWNVTHPYTGSPVDQPGGLDRWVSDVVDSSTFWPYELAGAAPSVNGYDPLLQRDYSVTTGDMAYNGYVPTPTMWQGGWLPDILRTTTLLVSGYSLPPTPAWAYQRSMGDAAVYSYTPRLADAYLIGEAKVRSLDEARAGINNPDTPLTTFAYVDTGTIPRSELPRFAQAAQPGASGTVLSGGMDNGGYGTWSVTSERPSLFVTSYAWMEGWTATVDGKPAPVARTNALVLGVPVPAGTHTVTLRFTPPGWTTGRNITIIALVIVVLLLVTDNRWVRSRLRTSAWRQRLKFSK